MALDRFISGSVLTAEQLNAILDELEKKSDSETTSADIEALQAAVSLLGKASNIEVSAIEGITATNIQGVLEELKALIGSGGGGTSFQHSIISETAYQALVTAGTVDADTMYFTYEEETPSQTATLSDDKETLILTGVTLSDDKETLTLAGTLSTDKQTLTV